MGVRNKMSNNFIKDFWEKRGESHGKSHKVSWGDLNAINLEIAAISKYINDGETVLDVGCANGYSTIQQAKRHDLKKIIGIDFATSMINSANKQIKHKNITFKIGNMLNLEFSDNYFDVAYTTRALINLPTWEYQMSAFEELYRVTKIGGKIIISEVFWEPLCLLNSLRLLLNLSPLRENDFNRYLKKEKLETFLNEKKLKFINEDFSSVYHFGSRLLRELVTDYDNYSNPFNYLFFDLANQFSGGGVGIQQLYVIKKV